ncbi:uncharacterized protein EKO05_0006979 [Ascochyta rabiei]|uniref:Uncharacterized protein n=1 Tax=Didymella rabiei TaxID=5454 RepID=A0A162YZ57_DIDRA|nr:uncharacterized protein EKO05_0006979 [Ascochyta rabiei]KZM20310.1 hypothetical protein ST47_g8457 [Ascochyta rabiei]UPX16588.1 hypothetical protein EKO05_0006979 [Ascochyta rabiei]
MAGKREHDENVENTLRKQSCGSVEARLSKKQKQDGSATDTAYTVRQILEFKDGISKIKNWKSNTIKEKHVQIIYWSDIEGLSRVECAKRYPNKNGNPCSATAIYKIYIKHAPRFYAEKGIVFIPSAQRATCRAQVHAPTYLPAQRPGHIGSRQTTDKHFGVPYKESRLDEELKELFNGLSETAVPVADPRHYQKRRDHDQGIEATVMQSDSDEASLDEEMIRFRCELGDIRYECSSTIEMKRVCAMEFCKVIREALQDNPDICTIQYGPEFSADTVSRFVACCSPKLQPSLPSHITTSFGVFKQEWTMPELEDLCVFAISVGAPDICDMVIDFWHKEMQGPEQRVVHNEFGDAHVFSILDFEPEFLNFLLKNNVRGFKFFLNVLIMHGQTGPDLLCDMHLRNWHTKVKNALISIMKSSHAIDLVATPPEIICDLFHHHDSEEHTRCYKRQTLGPPPQLAFKTPRPGTKAPTPGAQGLHPSYDTDSNDAQEAILQISVPSFPCVRNRYARIKDSDRLPGFDDDVSDRLRKIRNMHFDNRLYYADPKHNAHYDTKTICEDKIRLVRRKISLFKEEGIELSDGEFERLMGKSTGSDLGTEEDDDEVKD